MSRKIACIDLGSNSFLLSIARLDSSGLQVMVDECRVVGIAKRLTPEGRVSAEALERARKVLSEYRNLISEAKVDKVIAVATESLRRPTNGEAVKAQLENFLGHNIQIISPEKEAELSFWSVEKDPLSPPGKKLVFDIGGASTELIVGESKGIEVLTSLKLGSVVLTELFELERPSPYNAALLYCRKIIEESSLSSSKVQNGIGVAGTVTTLLSVHHGIETYRRDLVHGASISKSDLRNWLDRIFSLDLEARKKIKGLPAERADVFGSGALIALALMEHFEWDKIWCFDTGVRYGLIYEELKL